MITRMLRSLVFVLAAAALVAAGYRMLTPATTKPAVTEKVEKDDRPDGVVLSNAKVAAAGIELATAAPQHGVERLGLAQCARETIEDKTLVRVRLVQPVGNDADDDIVRHQPAAGHDILGLEADRRLRRHRGAQHLSGGELNDAVPMNQSLRLRSLARPRRPEKDQSHLRRPLNFDFLIKPSY